MFQQSRLAYLLCLVSPALAAPAAAQFVRNTTHVPTADVGDTENVDFGDVDGDGDWDAVFADNSNQQSRIWINQGGAQGGVLGSFVDDTAARFPAVLAAAHDIEFADIDRDGDLDVHVSTHSDYSSQPSRWWVNQGGVQGGSAGYFQDQTQSRWLNLGVNNGSTAFSSMPASQVFPSGGFYDWTSDSDFGDLDNDGDLDLLHSSYGFNGTVPTRLFLNDGSGRFEEFNPSGFQQPGVQLVNGQPGLWCAGTQLHNTTDSTGLNCDIASNAVDIDVGDIDGDLDLDILHGARASVPRMFANRYAENANTLVAFRDVTGSAFPAGYATGTGSYEQELGDLDSDGDLDIYGLNWVGLTDITLRNTGTGVYDSLTQLLNSAGDDEDGDFLDYDMDGDLDLFVAAYTSQNRLYRNDYAGAGFSFSNVTFPNIPASGGYNYSSWDTDACDVDHDGDTDLFVAHSNGKAEWYLQNQSSADDTFAPVVVQLEQLPDRTAGPAPTVVRAQVYDNAPDYITVFNRTEIRYSVNLGPYLPLPMASSAGQIFRGEIPGDLVGTIYYRVRSWDEYGNTGLSTTKTYVASCDAQIATYCTAKVNSLGCVPSIGFTGIPSATATSGFLLTAANELNNKVGLVLYSEFGRDASALGPGGLLCIKPPTRRSKGFNSGGNPSPPTDCSGMFAIDFNTFARGLLGTPPNPAPYLSVPGQMVTAQFWGRDPGIPLPNNFSLSNALELTICP